MKRIIVGIVMGAFALGLAAPLAAQNSKDEIKKRILKKVEEHLKKEEERILKEIEKIIDEELGLTSKTPPKEKKPGFVGINIGELSAEDREQLGLGEGEGVIITVVQEGAPGEKAGLQEGDVVLSVGAKKVGAVQSLIDEIKKAGAGETVTLKILRGDEEKEIKVTLTERPEEQPERAPTPPDEEPKRDESSRERMRERIREFMNKEKPVDEPAPVPVPDEPAPDGGTGFLGIMVDEIGDDVRAQFDIEEGVGVVVTAVQDGSPAATAGLELHDLVLKLDGKWLRGERDLAKLMKRATAGQSIELTVLTAGKERVVKAVLAAKP